ncbi:MAG: TonB-dependent vitamin B12 receptor [Armatimonadetes bacterium CSP1-3]|nr:MAG: TonB-dependent vitamin B12 receptor [Armatimonadetes bacterium CSP1-3]
MALRVLPTGIAAVGVFLLLTIPARGQVPTFEGEEVTVPGLRPQLAATTPAFVTVLSGEDLRRLGFVTLGDALRFLAEVSIRTAGAGPGGFMQASIRGSTPQQVLVLIDGVPLNATAQFGVNLSTIALADVERVEILRGSYSAIYGNALGGVVSVKTRADVRPVYAAGGGSFGSAGANLRVGRAWPGGQFTLSGQYLGTAGDRPNSDATRWIGTFRLALGSDPQRTLTLVAQHSAGAAGLPGPTFFLTPNDRLTDMRTLLNLTWAEEAGGRTTQARLWWLGDGLAQTSPGFSSDDRGTALGGGWQEVIRLPNGAGLTGGLELSRITFTSTSTFASFQGDATTGAGYLQFDALLGPRTLLGVGARYDVHSTYGPQVNPRLGVVHFLSDRVRLRGSAGRAFRAPTFFELNYPGCSNPALRPEQAWAADLGLEAAPRPGLTLRLNGFYTDALDLIVGGCNPQNVGSARVAGLSAEVVGRLGPGWTAQGNLTWTDGVDRGTGLPLLRLPAWLANLALRHAWSSGAAATVLVNYVSARDDLDTSTFPATRVTLPGYVTVGLRYERRLGSYILLVGVDNVMDSQYETLRGFPAAGRTFFVQVGSGF